MAKMRIQEEWNGGSLRGEEDAWETKGVTWQCPACGHHHFVYIEMPNPWGWAWSFNGDLERPTLNPSVDGDKTDPAKRCHCVITDGVIHYQNDQGSNMAEWRCQAVPMVDL